ncbi:hypothetical protein IT402_00925 [Candidatus Nomurabacteria bacterium]|nr:hypothetical protein [Candidatus Nomurabacteria bacterium]
MQIKSASMLVTNNGYCVKIMFSDGSDICFFVDKQFNHVPWKLTIKKGIILDHREYWRMRQQWKLEEKSLFVYQTEKAVQIAEKLLIDPYLGLNYKQRRKLNIPTTEEMIRKNSSDSNNNNVATGVRLETQFGNQFDEIKRKIESPTPGSQIDKFQKKYQKKTA